MQIDRPPPTGTSATVQLPASATRADNPLATLVGQVVAAQVTQSKAVATAQAVQYQSILQIGNGRIVVTTDQPLQTGTQLQLKVTSPQAIQIVEQPASATTAQPPAAPATDLATSLLNTVLRQALPLQRPITELLATVATAILLDNKPPTVSGQANPLAAVASSGNAVLPGLSAATAAALKPLLVQILRAQLTPESITQPDALRNAFASSGLFRESRLVQWAQAMLKQFPNASPAAIASSSGAATSSATSSPATTGISGGMPSPAGSVNSALLNPHTAIATAVAHYASTQPSPTQASLPLASLTKAIESAAGVLNTDNTDTTITVPQKTPVITANNPITSSNTGATASNDVAEPDIDALRNELLKALTAKMQKSMPGAATPAAVAATSASAVTTPTQPAAAPANPLSKPLPGVVGNPPTASGIPINARTATAAPGIHTDDSAPVDTKTSLEKLVSFATRQLISGGGTEPPALISEEHVLALLRQLPAATEIQATSAQPKPQDDDNQWLLQLLRNGFGALKHLQLQQATNLSASTHQTGPDTVAAPVQIELPLLVAQQWHSVNIEIDPRAPDNKPEGATTERSWRVTLRFELPQQGVIVAQLNLSGVHVNATLWAEKQATCQQLQQQLQELSERLGKAGAHVNTLDVRHGQPPSAKTRIEQRLIDIRT